MEIIKLSEVRSGEECLIHKVEVEDNAKHKRLCELGFCAGLKVYVLKKNKKYDACWCSWLLFFN